jgi:hypothetical protein
VVVIIGSEMFRMNHSEALTTCQNHRCHVHGPRLGATIIIDFDDPCEHPPSLKRLARRGSGPVRLRCVAPFNESPFACNVVIYSVDERCHLQ